MAKKTTHSAEGLPTQDRFDSRLWSRYSAVVQLGNVSKAVVLPGPGLLVVAAPSRRTAVAALRKLFPNPGEAREFAHDLGRDLA